MVKILQELMDCRYFLFFLAFVFLFSSCLHKKDHTDYAYELMFSYAKEAQEKNKLELSGFGGSMMHEIEKFDLSFTSPETPHVEEARKLFIGITDNFIQKVNSSHKIRPFLHEHPMTHKNLKLHLSFNKSKQLPPPEKYVAFVFVSKETLCYAGYDSEKHEFFDIYEEPYEEAVKIVQGMTSLQ